MYGDTLETLSKEVLDEFKLNLKGVKEILQSFICDYNAMDKSSNDAI